MKVKNWENFQHFKDRRPIWIKLYREVLDQRDINVISDCAFRVLVCCWLYASEDKLMEGNLPPIEDIAWRMRRDEKEIVKALQELTHWIEFDDIDLISKRYQLDDTEKEKRREEKEKRKNIVDQKSDRLSVIQINSSFEEIWKVYPNKQGKKEAFKHFKATVKKSEDLDKIVKALNNYEYHLQNNTWKRPMNGSTWFNNWQDWTFWEEPKAPVKKDATLETLKGLNNEMVGENTDGTIVDISPTGSSVPAIE